MQQCMFVLESDSQFKTHDSVLCLGFIENGIVDTPNSHQPGAVRRRVKSYAPLGDTLACFRLPYILQYTLDTQYCVLGFFLFARDEAQDK